MMKDMRLSRARFILRIKRINKKISFLRAPAWQEAFLVVPHLMDLNLLE